MIIRFRIVRVDPYGYNGREYHPSASDEGLIVRPVKLDSVLCRNEDYVYQDIEFPHPRIAAAANNQAIDGHVLQDEEWLEQCWTCVTPDGRFLELMEHELELASAGDVNGMQFGG